MKLAHGEYENNWELEYVKYRSAVFISVSAIFTPKNMKLVREALRDSTCPEAGYHESILVV